MKAWYVVHAKPKQEQTALINLERQEYECFLPMAQMRRRRKGELVLSNEPLFPRYLFIHLEMGVHNFNPIRSTRGVAQLVRFGGVPARIPTELIELLQQQESSLQERATTQLKVTPGDKVRVMEGVLAGYEGVFEKNSGTERAVVLLDLADKYTRIQVELESLDKI